MKYTISTPEGTKDRLFDECHRRRTVENAITEVFRQNGYGEVITPAIEYYDLFTCSGNPMPQESMLKIIDRTGSIMVMRPDGTAPTARLAATKLVSIAPPHRLYYNQTVFRSGAENVGAKGEVAQCGVELIGALGLKADVEVILTAIGALDACGLKNYYLELGHAGYFTALVSDLGASGEISEQIRSLTEAKNFAALNDVIAPFADKKSGVALKRLSRLFGGAEVLSEAKELFSSKLADEAIDYLETLYNELVSVGYGDRVRFDLGLVHQIEYYTGAVFRAYVRGAADSIVTGGRYDSLIGAFGRSMPATGFAIDIEAVASCVEIPAKPQPDTMLYYDAGFLNQAMEYMQSSSSGSCVMSLNDTIETAAAEAKSKGVKRIVRFSSNGKETIVI